MTPQLFLNIAYLLWSVILQVAEELVYSRCDRCDRCDRCKSTSIRAKERRVGGFALALFVFTKRLRHGDSIELGRGGRCGVRNGSRSFGRQSRRNRGLLWTLFPGLYLQSSEWFLRAWRMPTFLSGRFFMYGEFHGHAVSTRSAGKRQSASGDALFGNGPCCYTGSAYNRFTPSCS